MVAESKRWRGAVHSTCSLEDSLEAAQIWISETSLAYPLNLVEIVNIGFPLLLRSVNES